MVVQSRIPMPPRRRMAAQEAFARVSKQQHPEPDPDQRGGASDGDADNRSQRRKMALAKFRGM